MGITLKLYKTQGDNIIKAITKGNSIVQQNDINWSYRILGNEALAHIKTNIIIHDFSPKIKPDVIPCIRGLDNNVSLLIFIYVSPNLSTRLLK